MLSIANEVDLLIFCCVCFVCNTNIYFSNNLRVAPYQLARNNVISILGFFENRSSYIHIAKEELGAAPTIVVTKNSNPPSGVDIPDMETDILTEGINYETFLNSISTVELRK